MIKIGKSGIGLALTLAVAPAAHGQTSQTGIDQIGPATDRDRLPQVTTQAESRRRTNQIGDQARSVGGADAIGGSDRCDPAAGGRAASLCDDVVEARAEQFTQTRRPSLTAEQRLLIDQRIREAPGGLAATGQPGVRRVDPDASDVQSVASIVLRPGDVPAATGTGADSLSPESAAIIQALTDPAVPSGSPR